MSLSKYCRRPPQSTFGRSERSLAQFLWRYDARHPHQCHNVLCRERLRRIFLGGRAWIYAEMALGLTRVCKVRFAVANFWGNEERRRWRSQGTTSRRSDEVAAEIRPARRGRPSLANFGVSLPRRTF